MRHFGTERLVNQFSSRTLFTFTNLVVSRSHHSRVSKFKTFQRAVDMTLMERPRGGRKHGYAVLVALAQVAAVAFCAWRPSKTERSTALGAFKRPEGYSRRPLRPSRFEDGPDKEGEGRGEWQGDAGKFTVNWGDPRIGRQSSPWEESEPGRQRKRNVDVLEEVETEDFEKPRRAPPRRPPRRRRRMRTRSMEDADAAGNWEQRRESWRPPISRRERAEEPKGEARRDPRRSKKASGAPETQRKQIDNIKLSPPARPINLEAMAQKGLPIVNLYQLEPYDFYVYLIRELGIERMHAKMIRQWIFEKGVQELLQQHCANKQRLGAINIY